MTNWTMGVAVIFSVGIIFFIGRGFESWIISRALKKDRKEEREYEKERGAQRRLDSIERRLDELEKDGGEG